jgi:hypothetical protein
MCASCSSQGRLAIVTDAGQDAMDARRRERRTRCSRTGKSCGSDAPMLASSWRRDPPTTVARKPVAGKSTKESVKPSRRECRTIPGVTVVTMLVCFFILHARLRAHLASGIPCALFSGPNEQAKPRASAARSDSRARCLKLNLSLQGAEATLAPDLSPPPSRSGFRRVVRRSVAGPCWFRCAKRSSHCRRRSPEPPRRCDGWSRPCRPA